MALCLEAEVWAHGLCLVWGCQHYYIISTSLLLPAVLRLLPLIIMANKTSDEQRKLIFAKYDLVSNARGNALGSS